MYSSSVRVGERERGRACQHQPAAHAATGEVYGVTHGRDSLHLLWPALYTAEQLLTGYASNPTIKQRLSESGFEPQISTPEEFRIRQ